ncbi:hypothetical protein DXG03_008816 [Asterophora parasitica]|uniref:DUF3074 domain-containing protein n=1 Tax=Asterophora parasitica TaxID=117018 RepID=A0A9P7KDV5_9AGAR|nr:hypothetical protein DXG03_008816 [Asterophora parasitica]
MSTDQEFSLSLPPLNASDIPPQQTIITAGRRLIDSTSTSSWKQGKTYGSVKTLSRPKTKNGKGDEAETWHCRVSTHAPEEATFDAMWAGLAQNKAVNEKAYVYLSSLASFIPELTSTSKVASISPTAEIWTLGYTFPWPVSPRVFTVLQVVHLDEEKREGIIVSIPIVPSTETKGAVRGRYVSVETLREVEVENGVGGQKKTVTEWRMATASTTGGLIPVFVAEASLPGKISEDVPRFLEWLKAA